MPNPRSSSCTALMGMRVSTGNNDPYVPQAVLQDLALKLAVTPTIIPQGGHLNQRSGYGEFPLLLEKIQDLIFKEGDPPKHESIDQQ